MIKGQCRTNLDNYKMEEWPKDFVCVPKVGERVRAESGNSLRVCGITYALLVGYRENEKIAVPGVIIELNR